MKQEQHNSTDFKKPNAFVDTAIFTVLDDDLHVLVVKRSQSPFKDIWSLVGGFIDVEQDSSIEDTAKRKLFEKTGVKTPYLEQFGSIGNAARDPRGWSITNIYFALIPNHKVKLQAGKGAIDIEWAKITEISTQRKLAFDHEQILEGCIERLRKKVLYTSLPVHLMPKYFTLRELQDIYEIILGHSLEHKSFRRRILNAEILEQTDKMQHEKGRPAILYKVKNSQTHFFVRNIEGER